MPRHVPDHDAPFGARPPIRALFVDRWGTLLELPPDATPRGPEDVRFVPGAIDALWRAQRAGWLVYLVGNEEAVANGRLPEKDWQRLEAKLLGDLDAHGIALAGHYACTTHPRGIAGKRGDSVYRLPNTGAFYHAQHHDGVSLRDSWVIGDSTLEHVAAWRAGLRCAAVRTGVALSDAQFEVEVQLVAADLAEAVDALLRGSWKVAA